MSERSDKLNTGIESEHHCSTQYVDSTPGFEAFQGQVIWEGMVEVFSVFQPPPMLAYGWAVESNQVPQSLVLKGFPPVDSALAAVRVWLVQP